MRLICWAAGKPLCPDIGYGPCGATNLNNLARLREARVSPTVFRWHDVAISWWCCSHAFSLVGTNLGEGYDNSSHCRLPIRSCSTG